MINVTKDVESINPSLLKLKTQFPNSLQKLDIGKLVHSQHMYRTLKCLMSWLIIHNEGHRSSCFQCNNEITLE